MTAVSDDVLMFSMLVW